jgi:hypothetical protein
MIKTVSISPIFLFLIGTNFVLGFPCSLGKSLYSKCQDSDTVTILILGDNNFQNRKNPSKAFKNVQGHFDNADAVFLNLEGPFAKGWNKEGEIDIPHKKWSHSGPEQVEALVAAGITGVGVANNVTYPYKAMLKSLEVLEQKGILYSGGGGNLDEARQPIIKDLGEFKVGYIQYAATVYPSNHAASEMEAGILGLKVHTYYQSPPQLDKPGQPPIVITRLDSASVRMIEEDIAALKSQVDFVIAACHWGVSDTYNAIDYQKQIASHFVVNGADLVVGHGPHRFQELEVLDGVPVFYSIGQGVFDDPWNNRSEKYKEGMMIKVQGTKSGFKSIKILPLWRDNENELFLPKMKSEEGSILRDYILKVVDPSKEFLEETNDGFLVKIVN